MMSVLGILGGAPCSDAPLQQATLWVEVLEEDTGSRSGTHGSLRRIGLG